MFIKTDTLVEVTEEVFAVIQASDRAEIPMSADVSPQDRCSPGLQQRH